MLEIIIIVLGILLDQLSKAATIAWIKPLPGGDFALWPGVFHLTYVENRGASFGMLQGMQWLFITLTAVVVVALAIFLYKSARICPRSPAWPSRWSSPCCL